MKYAAFYDIDGTLVSCQTQQLLAKVFFEERLLSFFEIAQITLWFLIHKIGISNDSNAIRKKVYRAFSLRSKGEIDQLIEKTFQQRIKPNLNYFLKQTIQNHKKEGAVIVAISGTLEQFCEKVSSIFEIPEYFGTRLVVTDNRYRGGWQGVILEKEAKVKLARELALERGLDLRQSYVYADSFGDLPLLQAVGHPIVVGNDNKLIHYVKKQGWQILRDNGT